MTDCNLVNILIKTSCFIEILESGNYKKVDIKPCQYLIKKLMYLFYNIGPNITFAIGQLKKYNFDLKIGHMKVTKKVVKYLKGTIHLKLVYKLQSQSQSDALIVPFLFNLIRYKNRSYVSNFEDKKFVIRYYYFLNKAII